MRLALSRGELEILPCRSVARRTRFPQVSDETCMSAMQLVLPDGGTVTGADAVPELLRRIRGLGWLATAFARRVYGWIAKNRMRLSCER
jgi:predicted DCC family thiol-disulfide oxidoreductase YuxK